MKARFQFALCSLFVFILVLTTVSGATSQPANASLFSSQAQGLGTEHQVSVSTNPETDRYKPDSVYNTQNHQTLVVWHRNGGGSYFIEGRLINASGIPQGAAPVTLVSGATPVYQPAVAYNASDNQYLLVWMRNTLLDFKTYAIWGKILAADLTEVRSEFEILDPTGSFALWSPRVAWNAGTTRYMVVCTTYAIAGLPSTMFPVNIIQSTQYYNGDTAGYGTVIQNTPDNMIYPSQVDLVFANNDGSEGKYMWVWSQVKPGTADHDIWGANIDAHDGNYLPALPPFPIDVSTSDQQYPRLATNGANDFMVVWQERSPNPPNDWDIHGREMNQNGVILPDVTHVIAGLGSTNETSPFVAAWPGSTPRYVVGYERESETGKGIWLAYYNNGANTDHASNQVLWLDNFAAADYGFWTNSTPTGVSAGPNLQMAYQGISNLPADHTQIYSRAWAPFQAFMPVLRK